MTISGEMLTPSNMSEMRRSTVAIDEFISAGLGGHYAMILRAVRGGLYVVAIAQDIGQFGLPAGDKILTIIGDDPPHGQSKGPAAFDRASMDGVLKTADTIFLISCAPLPLIYDLAPVLAMSGERVALIETDGRHEADWFEIVRPWIGPKAVITALVRPKRLA